MRIRLLRDIRMVGVPSICLLTGTIIEVTPDIAHKWVEQGVAMEDKSIEPQEVKTDILTRPKPITTAPGPINDPHIYPEYYKNEPKRKRK